MSYDWKTFKFTAGSHKTREDGMCVMECVAYIAGENHSDHPKCADPGITSLAIWLNDNCLDDEERNRRLSPLMFRLAGSRSECPKVLRTRAVFAACYALDVFKPHAEYAAEYAAKYATKSAAGYAAKYAAKYATKYATESAAESAAKYAAKSAGYAAECAAKYAAKSANVRNGAEDLISLMLSVGEIKEQACRFERRAKTLAPVGIKVEGQDHE